MKLQPIIVQWTWATNSKFVLKFSSGPLLERISVILHMLVALGWCFMSFNFLIVLISHTDTCTRISIELIGSVGYDAKKIENWEKLAAN